MRYMNISLPTFIRSPKEKFHKIEQFLRIQNPKPTFNLDEYPLSFLDHRP